MPKSNIHILTEAEQKYFNDKYLFVIKDNNIIVKNKGYDRSTAHSLEQSFALKTKLRKLTISVDALDIWSKHFYNKIKTGDNDTYSLIDIQNAINNLIVSYQDISFANVLDVLNKSNRRK